MEGHTNTRLDSDKDSAYFVLMRSLFQFEIKEDMKKGRSAKENSKSTGKLIMILDPRMVFRTVLAISWNTKMVMSR